MLGYYPCVTGVVTRGPYRVREQCQVGSLTGAVASQRVTEALPFGTAGSLSPTFVPARLVGLAVKLPYAFTLCE